MIYLGGLSIGGGAPIRVQSMLRYSLKDLDKCLLESQKLVNAGCEVLRVALYSENQFENLRLLKKSLNVPLVADVHYVPRLAVKALLWGADGVRINPGNMKDREALKEIAKVASDKGKVVRVGVNLGSVPKEHVKRFKDPAWAMVNMALDAVELLESAGLEGIKISLKASDVLTTVKAYRIISRITDYPLHIGITEAGPLWEGAIKSSVGLGILLSEGIGDTIRVSLTGDSVKEVEVAYEILKSLGLRKAGVEVISCPGCGRCEIDLEGLVEKVREKTKSINKHIKIAVMGCVVNGPGEARDADIGIAGGKKRGVIFKKGKIIETVEESFIIDRLLELINEEVDSDEDE